MGGGGGGGGAGVQGAGCRVQCGKKDEWLSV